MIEVYKQQSDFLVTFGRGNMLSGCMSNGALGHHMCVVVRMQSHIMCCHVIYIQAGFLGVSLVPSLWWSKFGVVA